MNREALSTVIEIFRWPCSTNPHQKVITRAKRAWRSISPTNPERTGLRPHRWRDAIFLRRGLIGIAERHPAPVASRRGFLAVRSSPIRWVDTAAGERVVLSLPGILSRVIYEHTDDRADIRIEAGMQGSGHVYVLDRRTADPGGRVPPEDIIGAVRVEAGVTVAGSFQHNPRHRPLTHSGFFRLPQQLKAALHRRLCALVAEQSGC
jgi:hypothetical protein